LVGSVATSFLIVFKYAMQTEIIQRSTVPQRKGYSNHLIASDVRQ
jgi:hypothetical protein